MATVKVSDFPRRHTQHHQFQDCELGIAIWTVSDASLSRYSFIHRLQKCCARARSSFQCFREHTSKFSSDIDFSGMEVSGPPMRKCPGVRMSPSLGSSDRAVRGLEFKSASIWISMVDSCSYVRMMFPIIFLRMVFVLLIPASQRPPKLGARGGMVTQLIAWFSRYAAMSLRFVLLLQNSALQHLMQFRM